MKNRTHSSLSSSLVEAVTGYVSASFSCNPLEHRNKPFLKGKSYDKDYWQVRSHSKTKSWERKQQRTKKKFLLLEKNQERNGDNKSPPQQNMWRMA